MANSDLPSFLTKAIPHRLGLLVFPVSLDPMKYSYLVANETFIKRRFVSNPFLFEDSQLEVRQQTENDPSREHIPISAEPYSQTTPNPTCT